MTKVRRFTAPAPSAPTARIARRNGGPPPVKAAPAFQITTGPLAHRAQRVVLYGAGGSGKTTLSALAPSPLMVDFEDGSRSLDIARLDGPADYATLRALLRDPVLAPYATVVLDSGTVIEDVCLAHVLDTVKVSGERAANIEAYGYGKGYVHLAGAFALLLQDCDRIVRSGRNVVLIAHETTETVTNPQGEDYVRAAPALQWTKGIRSSIREHVVRWADHVLHLSVDVFADREKKAQGGSSRTVVGGATVTAIAKSRAGFVAAPWTNIDADPVWTEIGMAKGGAA